MSRKVVDCRDHPSAQNCTLALMGEEPEVFQAAKQHAISVHGNKDTPELDTQIRRSMKDETEFLRMEETRKAS